MLACTACFNDATLFRWPLVDAAAGGFVLWSLFTLGITVRRRRAGQTASRIDRGEVWLAAIGLVLLAIGLLTLSWRLWMQVITLAWCGLLLARVWRAGPGSRWMRGGAAASLILVVISGVQAVAAQRSPSHMVHWLGRLSPHVADNSTIAAWTVRRHPSASPLLLQEFRNELAADRSYPNHYRISMLARVIGRIDTDEARRGLLDALSRQAAEPDAEISAYARAAIVLSYANLSGPDGFDSIYREWERRQPGLSADENLTYAAALCISDPDRARLLIPESVLSISESGSYWGMSGSRTVVNLRTLVTSCLAEDPQSGPSADEILESIYPQMNLPMIQK